ncbi:hypothetical protein QYM36_011493 [Artemia franciscana]|uniref:Uncharacterized protein n=1 Tax=Artemia franciscana TaxID=6661 RepID=A0AA88HVC1_ARTSF|nr:hypothetical protein QYM36_011493 [Artemia franciscana]
MIDAVNSLQTQHLDGPNAIMRAVDQNLNLAFKTNTRAEANVLPTSDYRCMIPTLQLQTTRDVLTIYTGEKLEGTCISHLRINYKDRGNQIHPFYLVNTDHKPILSSKTSQDMKPMKFIINLTHYSPASMMGNETAKILDEYRDVFEGVGKLPGKCKIHLKEGVVPTVQPPKRVPFVLQQKLKEELDLLELVGIIEKTSRPNEWVNSIVVVQKPNGSVRICLDTVDLNKWVQRRHNPIPSFDNLASKCSGTNRFFKLDARNGYWSMELDEE